MGLLNARNLRRAKQLLDKNRHKVGDVVEKAGTQLDKVSKGRTSNVTAKASDAARKYSSSGVTHHGVSSPAPDLTPHGDPLSAEEAKLRQAQATTGAANAVSGVANALTNLMNKAAAKAEGTNASKDAATGTGPAEATSSDDP
ncbi:MAG: antitoxin, partial [Ilumatobacter sp.]